VTVQLSNSNVLQAKRVEFVSECVIVFVIAERVLIF